LRHFSPLILSVGSAESSSSRLNFVGLRRVEPPSPPAPPKMEILLKIEVPLILNSLGSPVLGLLHIFENKVGNRSRSLPLPGSTALRVSLHSVLELTSRTLFSPVETVSPRASDFGSIVFSLLPFFAMPNLPRWFAHKENLLHFPF